MEYHKVKLLLDAGRVNGMLFGEQRAALANGGRELPVFL
jgi:hypothetical protein